MTFVNPFKLYAQRKKASEPARHAKRDWKKRNTPVSFSKTVLIICLLFLFLPLLVIIFYSFNESKDTTFTGVSFIWYQKLIFDSAPLWNSLLNSFIVAITSRACFSAPVSSAIPITRPSSWSNASASCAKNTVFAGTFTQKPCQVRRPSSSNASGILSTACRSTSSCLRVKALLSSHLKRARTAFWLPCGTLPSASPKARNRVCWQSEGIPSTRARFNARLHATHLRLQASQRR